MPNPHADVEPTQAPIEIRAHGGRTGEWIIRVEPDRLIFRREDGGTHAVITREEAASRLEWQDLVSDRPHLAWISDGVTLAVNAEDASSLYAWLGPPGRTHLRRVLRRRLPWMIVLGAFWLVNAFGPAAATSSVVPEVYGVGAILGAAMIFVGVLGWFISHRVLFLVNGLLFLIALVATNTGVGTHAVVTSFFLVPIHLWLMVDSIKQFAHFDPLE